MSYNTLSFGIVYNKVLDAMGMLGPQWAQWMSTGLIPAVNNTTPLTIPGPFVNDAAAAAGGVPLGGIYYAAGGTPFVRIA